MKPIVLISLLLGLFKILVSKFFNPVILQSDVQTSHQQQ